MHVGVAAPPGDTPTLPFRVSRSKYRNLPVYTDYKSGGSQVLTSVRKIEGNLEVNSLSCVNCTWESAAHMHCGDSAIV